MMRTAAVMVVVSVALVLGCGRESGDQTGQADKVELSEESRGAKPQKPQEHHAAVKTEEGKPIEVGDDSFASEVLDSNTLVIVDFWAPWCRPCLIAAPVLEGLAHEYKGRLKVCKLNVDNARQTAMKYGIRSIPTLIFYKNGQPVEQIIGVRPNYEAQLRERIEFHL
jgi:thioredoxin 1